MTALSRPPVPKARVAPGLPALDVLGIAGEAIERCPFPINVFGADGTSVYVNRALAAGMGGVLPALDPAELVGRYNVLDDPEVLRSGRLADWLRAFRGEAVLLESVRQPLDEIAARHGIDVGDVRAVYQDIHAYPVTAPDRRTRYVVAVLVLCRVDRGRREVVEAIRYLEEHWSKPFDADALAASVGLSKSQLARVFKRHTGVSPRTYYLDFRLHRLKATLRDPDLSVSQAFAACGLSYNGAAAKAFKQRVGCTPSAYRRR